MSDILFNRIHTGAMDVLDLRQMQNSLSASNIANADTPHYKAKLIRFDELLEDAMGSDKFSLRRTQERHLMGFDGAPDDPTVTELEPPPWSLDGNSVQLEREMVRLKSNALMYRTLIQGMTLRVRNLSTAFTVK